MVFKWLKTTVCKTATLAVNIVGSNPTQPSMKTYNVWMEGYIITGNSGKAEFVGSKEAETFEDACATLLEEKYGKEVFKQQYTQSNNTWWGCRMFDNEADARKSYG